MPVKNKILFIYKFTLSLMLALFSGYILQYYTVKVFYNHSLLITSYLINGFIALLIFFFLIFVINKAPLSGMYAFVTGSAIKLACYFIVFYPVFKSDGKLTKPEFFTFFVPYALSLTLEIIYLVKYLKHTK